MSNVKKNQVADVVISMSFIVNGPAHVESRIARADIEIADEADIEKFMKHIESYSKVMDISY